MIELGTSDSGSRLPLRVGERASVRLSETATTGYRWRRPAEDADDGVLAIVEDDQDGPADPRGAGGERVFVLEAVRPGTAIVRLEKSRSWEREAPVEQFSITVEVGP